MAVLVSLPTEILWFICSILEAEATVGDKRSRQALSRLSRTCSALREVAQPLLFRDPYGTEENPKLLATAIEWPGLAAHVHRVATIQTQFLFIPDRTRRRCRRFIARGQSEEDRYASWIKHVCYEPAVRRLGTDFEELWITRLRAGNEDHVLDALAALYLAYFPSIRELDIWWPYVDPRVVNRLIQTPQLVPSYGTIHTLRVWQRAHSRNVGFGAGVAIFQLPALRQLFLGVSLTAKEEFALPPRSLGVTDLRWAGMVRSSPLCTLIRACRSLSTFWIELHSKHYDKSGSDLTPFQLVNALTSHATSLKSFTACFADATGYPLVSSEVSRPTRLQDFTALKTLTCDMPFLVLSNEMGDYTNMLVGLLPLSIEVLSIRAFHPADHLVLALEHFSDCLHMFKSLKKVEITKPAWLPLDPEVQRLCDEREYFAPKFKERGIEYSFGRP